MQTTPAGELICHAPDHVRTVTEQWRIDEHEIDGGWCGCEYPRLWPPRRREQTGSSVAPQPEEPK